MRLHPRFLPSASLLAATFVLLLVLALPGTAVAAPTQIEPAADVTIVDATPTWSWQPDATPGVDFWFVYLSRTATVDGTGELEDWLLDETCVTETAAELTCLNYIGLATGTWYWQVAGVNDNYDTVTVSPVRKIVANTGTVATISATSTRLGTSARPRGIRTVVKTRGTVDRLVASVTIKTRNGAQVYRRQIVRPNPVVNAVQTFTFDWTHPVGRPGVARQVTITTWGLLDDDETRDAADYIPGKTILRNVTA